MVDEARVTRFRRGAAKLNYMALDDPRIAFASKQISQVMSRPTEEGEVCIKRLLRFLKGRVDGRGRKEGREEGRKEGREGRKEGRDGMEGRNGRNGRKERWMDGWKGGRKEGRMDGWMDGWME